MDDQEFATYMLYFSLREFDSLRLGFATTTHRAQGMALDGNTYVLFGGWMQNREMSDVQISRAGARTSLRTGAGWTSSSSRSSTQTKNSRRTASSAGPAHTFILIDKSLRQALQSLRKASI